MQFYSSLLFFVLFLPALLQAKTVTDLAGREVALPDNVERIILGESRYIPALGILQPDDPVKQVVGMLPDFKLADPAGYQQYLDAFPHIEQIPLIGRSARDSFSVEQAIALNADVAIFGVDGHGPTSHDARLIDQLQQVGVVIVFIDFRQSPLENTPRSMALLGEVLGQQQRAEAFNQFYQQRLSAISETLETVTEDEKPRVFLHSRVGLGQSCCETMVDGMMGHFIQYLNVINIAADKVPGTSGILNREYLLVNQPDVYIATAIGSPRTLQNSPQFIALGAGINQSQARGSLKQTLDTAWLQQLDAVKQGRVYAVWHHFYNSPLNIAALEAFAKWLYPELFFELQPEQTLIDLYRQFQPIQLNGTYWTGLGTDG